MPINKVTHSAFLKIERASEHIEDIKKVLRDDPPFSYVVQSNTHIKRRQALVKRNTASIERIAIISGDAIHNLRAALDHVYWQIVSPHVTDPRARKGIQFPFSDTAGRLNEAVSSRSAEKVSAGFFNCLIDLKPYLEYGGNKPLALIHAMDVEDKHKLLIPVGDYKEITSSFMRNHFSDFPSSLTLRAGHNMVDADWGIRTTKDNMGDNIEAGIFEKKIDVPVNVVFAVEGLNYNDSVVLTLNNFIDVTKFAITAMVSAAFPNNS
ncbi:MAG: hypothetical protein KJ017_11245 [Alphaproteobacteria bacterium]|nr:hypothetical protein [Alphaproteobacteria bacterium]